MTNNFETFHQNFRPLIRDLASLIDNWNWHWFIIFLLLHEDYANFWFCVQLVWLLSRFSWSLWVIRSFDNNLCLLVLEKKLKNDIFHNIWFRTCCHEAMCLYRLETLLWLWAKKIFKILTSLHYWYPSIHKRLVFLKYFKFMVTWFWILILSQFLGLFR